MRTRSLAVASVAVMLGLLTPGGGALAQVPVADGPPYPMDTYFVAFLKRGAKWTPESTAETQKIQDAHMANIRKLADTGALVGAGPFGDGGVLRGIFIFKVASMDEARALTAGDPAVQAGRLAMDVYQWRGPKGIGEPYKARMKADPVSPPKMRTFQFAILKAGPAGRTPPPRELMRQHLGHITQLTRNGAMLAAGPFEAADEYQGLEIYATESAAEARAMAEQDPAVKAGVFVVELHPIYMDEGVLPPPATVADPVR